MLVPRPVLSAMVMLTLLAAPPATRALPAGKFPRIGFVEAGSKSANQHFIEAFRAGLRDLGYVEGQNIAIEERWAEGRVERFPDLLADLLRLRVDVIVQASSPGAVTAKKVATSVPVVFVGVADPVGLGLVESLSRPGGNVTGLSLGFAEGFAGKWIELFKEAVPRVSRVAVLSNPLQPAQPGLLSHAQTAATALGVKLVSVPVQDANGLDGAFAAMAADGVRGLIVFTDPLTLRYRARIVELAAAHRLPAMYTFGEFVRAGGLMAYGPSVAEMFRRAATYVDRILKGVKPADLPVEQPTKFELIINLKTAKALGLTIPPSVLVRADEVIE
jgi:putative tryptophan/tyrosine transport system substrate-binding protein